MRESVATDEHIVMEIRAGSSRAVAELFERHWLAAWQTAFAIAGRRTVADDVAQEALERALVHLDGFDTTRPFKPWLHRIVVNCALDELRRERRHVPYGEPSDISSAAIYDRFDDDDLLTALERLPTERRAVIVLRYWLDFTPSEISVVLDIPEGTVYSRLSRALTQLRRTLEVKHANAS